MLLAEQPAAGSGGNDSTPNPAACAKDLARLGQPSHSAPEDATLRISPAAEFSADLVAIGRARNPQIVIGRVQNYLPPGPQSTSLALDFAQDPDLWALVSYRALNLAANGGPAFGSYLARAGGASNFQTRSGLNVMQLSNLIDEMARDPLIIRMKLTELNIYKLLLGDGRINDISRRWMFNPYVLSYFYMKYIAKDEAAADKLANILRLKSELIKSGDKDIESIDLLLPALEAASKDPRKVRMVTEYFDDQDWARRRAVRLTRDELINREKILRREFMELMEKKIGEETADHYFRIDEIQYAFGHLVLGRVAHAQTIFEKIKARVVKSAEDEKNFSAFVDKLLTLSSDSDLERAYLDLSSPTLGARFFIESSTGPIQPDGHPLYVFDPRIIEVASIVRQFSNTLDGIPNYLEIGYGRSPFILRLLSELDDGKGNKVGIDTRPIPTASDGEFSKVVNGALLLKGSITDDAAQHLVQETGPYAAIYSFNQAARKEDLNWIRSHLKPGGVYIVINDRLQPPQFTLSDAMQAGFQRVRWNALRELPPKVRSYFTGPDKNSGRFSYYVLRNPGNPGEVVTKNLGPAGKDSDGKDAPDKK